MPTSSSSSLRFRPSLSLVLLCALLLILWVFGGASRADAAGQVVVRGAAALLLIVAAVFGERSAFAPAKPVWLLLTAAIALALIQLIPLPPDIWQALPGRAIIAEAAAASGQPQPWRPWSIVPGATVNAAGSLIVPLATLVLVTGLKESERPWLPGFLLALIVASTLLGLLQFSGAGFNNPFINDTPGVMSSSFANRNHFALFLALGCVLAPAWMFLDGRRPHWRGPVGLGLVLLFALAILASGSRAGLALGGLALVMGVLLVWKNVRRELSRAPRWVLPVLAAAVLGLFMIFVAVSIVADRAVAIQRVFEVDPEQDMRSRALPTVLTMVWTYFPVGSGLGGFDPMFRIHEPFELLKPTYFNHAHNDLIEIVLDAGFPGLLLLLSALAWWGWASLRAWRTARGSQHGLARLGSAVLLLIVIASALDYPGRTPMMMALIIIAGVWLSGRTEACGTSALPGSKHHL